MNVTELFLFGCILNVQARVAFMKDEPILGVVSTFVGIGAHIACVGNFFGWWFIQ